MSSSTVISKIRNDNGDLKWENEVHLRVFRNDVPIRKSSKYFITLETKHNDFHPRATIISSDEKISLQPEDLNAGEEVDVDGVPNYRYEWRYI